MSRESPPFYYYYFLAVAHASLVPRQGSNLRPLQWKGTVQSTDHQEVPAFCYPNRSPPLGCCERDFLQGNFYFNSTAEKQNEVHKGGSFCSSSQTTMSSLSSFQYTGKAHPTGNRENWGEEGRRRRKGGVDTGPGPTSWAEGSQQSI